MSENRANLVYGISNGSETVGIEVQTDKIFLREFWGFCSLHNYCSDLVYLLSSAHVLEL